MLTSGPGRGQAAVSVDSLRVSRPPDSPRNVYYVAANLNTTGTRDPEPEEEDV